MKSSNLITALLFTAVITGAAVFTAQRSSLAKAPDNQFTSLYETSAHEDPSAENVNDPSVNEKNISLVSSNTASKADMQQESGPESPPESKHESEPPSALTDSIPSQTEIKIQEPIIPDDAQTGDSLFIGDSRTVGLYEYAEMQDTDFFANVGMTVYNIRKKAISVPGVGKVTLDELLEGKKYSKAYLMLGINEIGYNTEKTVKKYRELIDFIREKQPDTKIFIQANLHVDEERSSKDAVINNPAINSFNNAISEIADSTNIFYLDANVLFDDKNGNLSADKTEDGTHPYAKYYSEWGRWLEAQTLALTGKGSNP